MSRQRLRWMTSHTIRKIKEATPAPAVPVERINEPAKPASRPMFLFCGLAVTLQFARRPRILRLAAEPRWKPA